MGIFFVVWFWWVGGGLILVGFNGCALIGNVLILGFGYGARWWLVDFGFWLWWLVVVGSWLILGGGGFAVVVGCESCDGDGGSDVVVVVVVVGGIVGFVFIYLFVFYIYFMSFFRLF